MIARHRIQINQQSEALFRIAMAENGYSVPWQPLRSSSYPMLAFIIDAPVEEKFDFLRPRFLPPREEDE